MAGKAQVKAWFQERSVLFNASALSFIAFMITNIANYGTQVILGRMLGPEDYGSYNALMGLLVVLAVPMTSLCFLIARKISRHKNKNEINLIKLSYQEGLIWLFLSGFLLAFVLSFFIPLFRDFLHINNYYAVAWLGPIAMVSLFQPFNMAFLQGQNEFRWVAFCGAMAGPLRFLMSLGAAMFGWGVNGAMGAIFATGIFNWIISSIPFRSFLHFELQSAKTNFSSGLSSFIPVFISTISFIILTQCDVILVKHIFSSKQSGFYASAALLGKTVIYVPEAIIVALVPMVAARSQEDAWSLLKKAVLITMILSGCGAFLLWLVPDWILNTFFGTDYLSAAPILKYFGLSMLPMAFILVLKAYFIAKNANQFSYVILSGAIGMMVSILFFAQMPTDVLMCIGVWGCVIASVGFAMEYLSILRIEMTKKEYIA